jgi:hypothetical protein
MVRNGRSMRAKTAVGTNLTARCIEMLRDGNAILRFMGRPF